MRDHIARTGIGGTAVALAECGINPAVVKSDDVGFHPIRQRAHDPPRVAIRIVTLDRIRQPEHAGLFIFVMLTAKKDQPVPHLHRGKLSV